MGFLIFSYKLVTFSLTADLSDRLTWAILAFTVGVLSYSLLSAAAHLMHSQSEERHYFWFQIDYIGIGMNATGTSIYLYFLTGPKAFYETCGDWFIIINILNGVANCLCCSVSKLCYCRPYPFSRKVWMMVPVASSLLYGAIPLWWKTYECLTGAEDPGDTLKVHYISIACFLLSAVFFSQHFPEQMAVGVFDIFGHGHSLFHIIMTLASMLQFDAAVLEYSSKTPELKQMLQPSFLTAFGPLIIVFFTNVLIVYHSRYYRLERVKADTILHQQKRQ